MKQADSRNLLQRVQARDADAFASLYDMLAKPIYVIAYRITQNKAAAEDITQEIFLRLWESPPGEDVQNPRAWIFRAVHNLAVDNVRRPVQTELPESLPAAGDEIDTVLIRTDLERAMGTLTSEERETVSLYVHAGLTFGEIGKMTSRSLPSVYRCYQRALKRLRAALEEESS